ncbi:hypothetical protein Peur_048863 [Populus x canadensis]
MKIKDGLCQEITKVCVYSDWNYFWAFQSVCRVMSVFSYAFYIEMKVFFSGDRILARKPPYYRTVDVPDMWFSAEFVWEIRGADFTISPVH